LTKQGSTARDTITLTRYSNRVLERVPVAWTVYARKS